MSLVGSLAAQSTDTSSFPPPCRTATVGPGHHLYLSYHILASSVFPALGDLMDKFEQLKDKKKEQRLKEIKKHISDIMLTFRRAASWLDDDVI